MKKIRIIQNVAFTIIVLLLCIGILNFLYVTEVVDHSRYTLKEDSFSKHMPELKTVFVGDSHVEGGINPLCFPESFNYGIGGDDYEQFYLRAREVMKSPSVETLIVPLDLHSFSDYCLSPYSHVWYWANYMTFEELSNVTGKTYPVLFIQKHFPFIGNGRDFKVLISTSEKSGHIRGWTSPHTHIFEDPTGTITQERVNVHFTNGYTESKRLRSAFDALIRTSNEKKIEVIFVTFPVTQQYAEKSSKYIDKEEFFSDIHSEYSHYGNIQFIDLQSVFFEHPEFFSDQDHLNLAGSVKFSKILRDEIYNLSPTLEENILC